MREIRQVYWQIDRQVDWQVSEQVYRQVHWQVSEQVPSSPPGAAIYSRDSPNAKTIRYQPPV